VTVATRQGDLTVKQPQQRRSRATMERIVNAVEDLLADRPFEQITVAEISAHAGCAPTAIYSKFSDKTAMLLEVYDRFKARVAAHIAAATETMHGRGASPREVLQTAAAGVIDLYSNNRRLLRSVLLADNAVMYQGAAELTRSLSLALADVLIADIPETKREIAEQELDFALRSVVALLQQDLLYQPATPSRFTYSDEDLCGRLTKILVDAYTAGTNSTAPSSRK
jgi:AcrR family transcriptional regulator